MSDSNEQPEEIDAAADTKSEDIMPTVLPKTSSKHRYKTLKRKLKFLLYEQECFREELVKIQKKILRVSMDKNGDGVITLEHDGIFCNSFLLDRLLKYENVPLSSSDEDGTASSSNESEIERKRKKTHHANDGSSTKSKPIKEKKRKSHLSKKSTNQRSSSNDTKELNGRASSSDKQLVRCAYVADGIQCQEIVSKSSKFSYCKRHRTVIRIGPKNGNSSSKSSKMIKYSLVKKGHHLKKGKERKKSLQGEFSRLSTDADIGLSQDAFSDTFGEKVEQPANELESSLDDLIEEELVIDMQE
ncbi:uncharacterized protein TRIADDRAFT_59811 [Trichoplax adhaerens]|uniref:INO80 complex subunit E N-terminal domain-containing protein n=1 Tax=Trichoplax adhaerens TaxID=10228 RepID=B3S6H9_TRIAD|nr:hypothetical protein TRIADDRAFT_59811 [Trichoplax adhaerens]EDV21762.1 hypothetical protein TRIADDRAFT_59811 [Trichoplax adhaerens]|eukprot:XP_002115910.1 hypothetical protein TRIADDRAFT_59811 [Trichoplax adhaerens]